MDFIPSLSPFNGLFGNSWLGFAEGFWKNDTSSPHGGGLMVMNPTVQSVKTSPKIQIQVFDV